MPDIENRLTELGLTLPTPATPVASYVGYVKTGQNLFISGQLPILDGAPAYVGKVGKDFSVEEGIKAAHLCAINILAQARAACGGDLNKIVRLVRLGGFVHCTENFIEQPQVINGASDLMVEVLGEEKGKHARAAVGTNALPLGVAVEIDALFEISF